MQVSTTGLRDRKRLATRVRMEQAAVELVLRDGLQHATVDAICDTADVAPRTFFNYFDSKEDAVLGLPEFDLTAQTVLRHSKAAEHGDVVQAIVGLILELTGPVFDKTELRESRAEILRRYPELFNRQVSRLSRITTDLVTAVHLLMDGDPRFRNRPHSLTLADPVLAMCSGAVRTAVNEWIAAGGNAPTDEIGPRAVAIAYDVVETLR